jgi:fimbrial isopeptide formation D2 family protein/LPXTG-motif cell wall-anchored protein
MKTVKKIVSVLLAVFMIVAMTVNAGATSGSITDHTFRAYQIFSGTQTTGETNLAEVKWGSGVNGDALLVALKDDDTFKESNVNIFSTATSAADVASILSGKENNGTIVKEFGKLAFANKTQTAIALNSDGSIATTETITSIPSGYYLIVDDTTFTSTENAVKNLALVRVTEDGKLTIENKTSLPTLVKKVQEQNDSTGAVTGWQDAADYDIGDTVSFKLTATLPDRYADYDKYKLVFHDTLSEGLTYQAVERVYVLNDETKVEFAGDSYTVTTTGLSDSGCSFEISFADLKTVALKTEGQTISSTSKIVVEYTAKLNEKAVIGNPGNTNTAHLEYSNNPNNSGDGYGETGTTPDDTVKVFTYQLQVKKIDGAGQELKGAGFTLYKKMATISAEKSYYTKEGFYTADDKYYMIETKTPGDATEFTFNGLDSGDYLLVESAVPSGYNPASDIQFTIAGSYSTDANDPKLNGLTVTSVGDETVLNAEIKTITNSDETQTQQVTGVIKTDVENNKGGTLPSTGGMGTTIFTVCGIVLMLGASILLVTRKRMSR